MLKVVYDETFVIPDPVLPRDDGLSLLPYVGPELVTATLGIPFAGFSFTRFDGTPVVV